MNKKKYLIHFVLIFLLILIVSNIYKTKTKPKSPFKIYQNYIPHTYRIGFTNLNEETLINNLEIKGEIPKWISGTLFRNGPAKFTNNNSFVSNWFDGLAMIHSFTIDNGNISYTNKFLRTRDYEHVKETGKLDYSGFVQDPCKSIFSKVFSYFLPKQKNIYSDLPNANINIAKLDKYFIALTETPLPVEFDPKTLETIGGLIYKDKYPIKVHDTPHPHYDSQTKEYLGYFTKFGRKSSHNFFRIKSGSTSREIIASYPIDKPAYMHSFAITQKYAILTLLPLRANPLDLLLKNQAFIKNFKWRPELGTEFLVIDRINGKLIGNFAAETFFAFHIVNAYEDNKNIIVDIVTYPDPTIIVKSNFNDLLKPTMKTNEIKLKRFIINLNNKVVKTKLLSSEQLELPRINYENYNGKDYNYLYAVVASEDKLVPFYVASSIIKLNVKSGEKIIWNEQNCFPGEPVFVPKPNSKVEDEGAILSIVLDSRTEKSFLLGLDAQTFKEIGRALLPHHIPFGIHGQFYNKLN